MTTQYEIEYKIGEDEYDVILVEFEGEPEISNDSFSYAGTHCTHGKSGTHRLPDYIEIEDFGWDEDKHTPDENKIIKTFLSDRKNWKAVANQLCEAFAKEAKTYSEY